MIAIFGGTFDPIHTGHINMAKHCIETLQLSTLALLPCANPVHKSGPNVSDEHRLGMLKLATENEPRMVVEDREIRRQGPSYSYLTLQELRAENPTQPICFLMGMDSFNGFDTWYNWQEIMQLCHIIVYQRPGSPLKPNPAMKAPMMANQTTQVSDLHKSNAGKIYLLGGKTIDISSSQMRKDMHQNSEFSARLPDGVYEYIQLHGLYADPCNKA